MASTRDTSIVLVGMPGVGKSTIGILLAKELAREFVDTDLLIQVHAKKALQDIVHENGYQHLRELEEAIILTLDVSNHVVSTGGSAIYGENAMAHLAKAGQIVFLDLPLSDLEARIHNMEARGIAKPDGQSFADVYAERVPLYRKYADITIQCRGKSPVAVVQEIIYEEGEQYADADA
ncbi:shikimate kinase [Gilvimarinus sp. SDUM040013]|uniref:Shikimate kinase n=1 Tax=Gilvimarinus gilvus TaxID=3058038 RepID=A0ABU4RUC3_9GAMM|nr:shikimate kinase [Gilvimarinus sp. SDUM040013]MDO3385105.1 shikimate kinase [Gilvimarinus sp. SDUM040013]MDX6848480.1 shikimate kinase [Gilvimarinus sp. SDUM040013]